MLVKEPRTTGDFDADRRNPLLAMYYGFSLTGCLQSGLATADGWGLGNMGMSQSKLEELAEASGFEFVEPIDVSDPTSSYYLVR